MTVDHKGALDEFSQLLASLYGGLLTDGPWESFLRQLASYLDSIFATLILTVPGMVKPGTIITPDVDPAGLDDYAQHYFARDPFRGLPEGRVISFSEFLRDQPQAEDFRREFLEPAGAEQILGVDLHFDTGFEGRLRVMRDSSRPDFGKPDREALAAIVPHLRNAIRLFERSHATGAEQGVYHGMVEQMGMASIILDHQCNIIRANMLAERLMEERDGLMRTNGRLRVNPLQVQMAIEALLRRVSEAGEQRDVTPLRLRIERPSGARDLSAVAEPVTTPTFLRSGRGAAIGLFITDPGRYIETDPAVFRDLFQLTRMEGLLAAELSRGDSLVNAADKLGIMHNTARSHLRSIFAKTGTHRQSQLVHLLQAGLAKLGSSSV